MQATAVVVPIRAGSVVASHVYNWLNTYKENTKRAKESDIKEFFSMVKGLSDINFLDESHISITREEYLKYYNELCEQHKKNGETVFSTVNRKLSSIETLFKELICTYKFIDLHTFNIKKRKVIANSYDELTVDESMEMINLARHEKENGFEKSVAIETAVITGFRQESLLEIDFKEIRFINGWWVIKVVGKGDKVDEKPILPETYNRIKKLREMNGDKIFCNLNASSCLRLIKRLAEKMGITDRNIVWHSLKAIGINVAIDLFDSTEMATAHGNHASRDTAMKHYYKRKRDFSKCVGVHIFNQKVEDFSTYNNDDLLKAIAQLPKSMQLTLSNVLKNQALN